MILALLLSCAPDDDVIACKEACDLVFVECAEHLPDGDVRECYSECRQSTWAGGWADEVTHIEETTYFPCEVWASDERFQSPCYAQGACE